MSDTTRHVLVLTSDRKSIDAAAAQVLSVLQNAGMRTEPFDKAIPTPERTIHWQCRFEATDGGRSARSLPSLIDDIRTAAEVRDGGIDVNILPDGPYRARKLLIADMESTIIEQEMLDELGDFIGARAKIEDITARAMRGELDFESALTERVGLLQGLPATVLDEVAKRITIMPGAETLIATMKAHGAYCALVSGGFTVFTSRVAERLGFDEHRANVLEVANGKLTGRVKRPILGRAAKLAALVELTARLGLKPEQTLAVGDGANDLDMIGAAGLGVAFRAKPKVRDVAAALPNGAVVTHGDLTALLALQGYAESEFAAVATG